VLLLAAVLAEERVVAKEVKVFVLETEDRGFLTTMVVFVVVVVQYSFD
jgi:hypothetical protein